MSDGDFTWVDGERLVRFGDRALADAPRLLSERGFGGYALVSTARAGEQAPELRAHAAATVEVPSGPVPDAAAAIRGEVLGMKSRAQDSGPPLVALGGGRVIDVAKALAAVDRLACAAVPTTLSGAPMTPFHRLPAGIDGVGLVRPSLVVAVPDLMASQPAAEQAASAMNALAHAVESLYVELSHPVARLAGLDAARLIAAGLTRDEAGPHELALGSLLGGYAVGSTLFGVHHVVCQTVVRVTGAPHALTNAVMLPHALRLMEPRAPAVLIRLAAALGVDRDDPAVAADLVAALAARAGATRLSELGVEREQLGEIAAEASGRPQLDNTPDAPGEGELLELLRRAL